MSGVKQEELWKNTRAGAWAGRGFHYQHLVITNLLVRQWAGMCSPAYVVPEGVEDCVLESKEELLWLQIKSKKSGEIGKKQLHKYLQSVLQKATQLQSSLHVRSILITESKEKSLESNSFDCFGSSKSEFFHCEDPLLDSQNILLSQLNIAETVIEGIVSEVYTNVANSSSENAYLAYEERRRLCIEDVEKVVLKTLEYSDFEQLDYALKKKLLEPVDFTPTVEPAFYKGVKTRPGHVAAGLVFGDQDTSQRLAGAMLSKRAVLFEGPSGAGKSSAMWASIYKILPFSRWFEVTQFSKLGDTDSIVRFVNSRKPTHTSPITLVMDEVNSENVQLWNSLRLELLKRDNLYIVGSIRTEDIYLLESKPSIGFTTVSMTDDVAIRVWEKLKKQGHTTWSFWKEPYELSQGLMLEYVHILTQGRRLAEIICDQVEVREKQDRVGELAVLRITATASIYGGQINAERLVALTGFSQHALSKILKRLLDEHLILETRPGVLGGLHELRSMELLKATHDEVMFKARDSVWKALKAVTYESLSSFVFRLLSSNGDSELEPVLKELALCLESDDTWAFWEGVHNGLGFYSCGMMAEHLISIFNQFQVRKSVWLTISLFAISGVSPPKLSNSPHWQQVVDALEAFQKIKHVDFRAKCLEFISDNKCLPTLSGVQDAIKFFPCLCPIGQMEPVKLSLNILEADQKVDLEDLIKLLAAVYVVSPTSAKQIVDNVGGVDHLLERYSLEYPWISYPKIEQEGELEGTVCADYYVVDQESQGDVHGQVIKHCKNLLALCPSAKAVAVKAVHPNGQLFKVGEMTVADKNIPRSNLPFDTSISWNRVFQILLSNRAYSDTSTVVAESLSKIVRETDYCFNIYAEKWIGIKSKLNTDKFAERVNRLIGEVNELYVSPKQVLPSSINDSTESLPIDRLSGALSGILSNFMTMMGGVSLNRNLQSDAAYGLGLVNDLMVKANYEIWAHVPNPPVAELKSITNKIKYISEIFHEFSAEKSESELAKVLISATKANKGKAIFEAAKHCRTKAKDRLDSKLRTIVRQLAQESIDSCYFTKKTDSENTYTWPGLDIAFFVEVDEVLSGMQQIETTLPALTPLSKEGFKVSLTLMYRGVVIPQLALKPSLSLPIPLPDTTFEADWKGVVKAPFFSSLYDEHLLICQKSIDSLSRLISCADLDALKPEEHELFTKLEAAYSEGTAALWSVTIELEGGEMFVFSEFLEEKWDELVTEFENRKSGEVLDCTLFSNNDELLNGKITEDSGAWGVVRLLLIGGEVSKKLSIVNQ